MKSRRFAVYRAGLALAVALSLSSAVRAELIVNGGFEDGLNGWTFTGDGMADVVGTSSDTPSGVGNSADFNITAGNGLPWLIQDVAVQAGATLTFSAWVREVEPASPADAWLAVQVWFLENSGSASIISSAALFFTSPEWQQQSTEVTVPATATIARVLLTPQNTSFGVGTGHYRIDDVSLTVPEPAAVFQLVGIAGMLAFRRRPGAGSRKS